MEFLCIHLYHLRKHIYAYIHCHVIADSTTVSIAQKMMNKEWVNLDDIANCGEVRGKITCRCGSFTTILFTIFAYAHILCREKARETIHSKIGCEKLWKILEENWNATRNR